MKTVIGPKTAACLFAAVAGMACWKLHGRVLAITLAIVIGLAAKSYLEYLRRRMQP